MIKTIKYHWLESYFKVRHGVFETFNNGYFKSLAEKYTPVSFKQPLLDRKLKKLLKFPETISIETTSVCNAKCWFCSQPDSVRPAGYMDFDLFKKIIDQIKDNMKYVVNIALFMDGEPTLQKELVSFLRYAASQKIQNIYISSNMEYFTPKLTDELFDANLGKTLLYVICSLDGVSPDVHRQNRVNVDFDKAIANTEYLIKTKKKRKANYPWVFTRLLENDLTIDEVGQFKEYWRGKADKVLISKMHNWGGQIEDERIPVLENSNGGFGSCYFPFSQLAIQCDGSSRICCVDTDGTALTGDLNRQSIEQVWQGFTQEKYRSAFINKRKDLLPNICKDCTYPSKGQWIKPFYWKD